MTQKFCLESACLSKIFNHDFILDNLILYNVVELGTSEFLNETPLSIDVGNGVPCASV